MIPIDASGHAASAGRAVRRSRPTRRGVTRVAWVASVAVIALGLPAPTASAAPAPTRAVVSSASITGLSQGDRGPQVKSLQQALLDAGVVVVGGADGVFGPATKAAVSAFQRDRGLSPTGSVDAATAESLAATDNGTGGDTATPTPNGSGYIGLATGASGPLVSDVQQGLMDVGVFVPGGADGAFGPATTAALRQFQRWNGLEATGTVTPATAKALGLTGSVSAPEPPAPDPQPPADNAYVGLEIGASGDLVRDLQRALMSAGITVRGGADGAFGPATQSALKGFQRTNDRSQTGVVSERDAADLGLGAPTPTPPPSPDTSSNPYVGLKIGARGALVEDVQRALIAAGISVRGGADGVFGNATKGGVVMYQRQQGLAVNGEIDAATAGSLALGSKGPSGVANPTPNPPTPPTSTNPYVGLAMGDEGDLVKDVQLALQSFGFVIKGGANGVFGATTRSTLMAFQSVNAIPKTGVVTEKGAAILDLGQDDKDDNDGGGTGPVTITLARFPVQGQCYFGDTWHAPRGGGRLHEGVDIIAPQGNLLYAVVDGYISKQYWDYPGALAGNGLRLAQDDGTYFTYLHMLDFAPGIKQGTKVKAGDVLGFVGNTGSSATPHVHFEVHPGGGRAINPYPLVKQIDDCKNTTPQYQGAFTAPIDASTAQIGMSE